MPDGSDGAYTGVCECVPNLPEQFGFTPSHGGVKRKGHLAVPVDRPCRMSQYGYYSTRERDMSIRKRIWTTADGKRREAFIVDFRDAKGHRTIKTFATEKEARGFRGQVEQPGHKHVAVRSSPTVRDAADRWLVAVEHGARRDVTEPVETATLRQYAYHIRQHIEPQLGDDRIGALTEQQVQRFRDRLLRKLSRGMAKKVMQTLKAILIEARYQGEALNVTVGKDSKRHKKPVEFRRRPRSGRSYPSWMPRSVPHGCGGVR